MKILVTGGGGFLGFEICKLLKEAGHDVMSFSRNHYEILDAINVKTMRGSLLNSLDIDKALDGVEAIFHTAAIAGIWGKKGDFYKTNYLGTVNLVEIAKKRKIKYFINTASPSVVFEKEDILNGDESLPYASKYLTHYAKTKAMAESYVLKSVENDFLALSLRPHLIFGKNDPHIIPRLIESAKKGRLKVVGNKENLVDVIHVSNAAHGHVMAFNKLLVDSSISSNAYFIGQEKPVNLWDFINTILIQKGEQAIADSVSFSTAYKIGAILEFIYKALGIYKPEPVMTRFLATQLGKSHYFSHAKAKGDFGYEVILKLDDAIRSVS